MDSHESGFPRTIQKLKAPADGEFLSLVSLLDDPDVRIANAVEDRLRARGVSMLHPLLEFIDLSSDELAKTRATIIAREFNEKVLLEEFAALRHKLQEKRRGALEDGVFLIARYGFPRLDTEYYKAELDALAGMMHDRIKGIMAPAEVLSAANDFFFKTRGFKGNHEHFLVADNSYINQVLDRRLGITISLAVIFVLIERNLLGLLF